MVSGNLGKGLKYFHLPFLQVFLLYRLICTILLLKLEAFPPLIPTLGLVKLLQLILDQLMALQMAQG